MALAVGDWQQPIVEGLDHKFYRGGELVEPNTVATLHERYPRTFSDDLVERVGACGLQTEAQIVPVQES